MDSLHGALISTINSANLSFGSDFKAQKLKLLPLLLLLTLQSLRQRALVARGCCHPAVGVAEAGRGHAVGGVLEEGVQEPETVCQNQMKHVTV